MTLHQLRNIPAGGEIPLAPIRPSCRGLVLKDWTARGEWGEREPKGTLPQRGQPPGDDWADRFKAEGSFEAFGELEREAGVAEEEHAQQSRFAQLRGL